MFVSQRKSTENFFLFSVQPTLNISPNPAQNEIQVQPLVQNDQTAHLTIVDISGKMVLSQTISMNSPTTISVAHLPDGMYFYQTRHADFPIQTHKLNILR
ncbi:MAG: T9SS type A sorting domain-containing protein [Chitinophagales bacterium]|nr:T9SS type A sorting domain-containing protein [Chitinophagales bacterium]